MSRYAAVRVVRESVGEPAVPDLDISGEYALHDSGVYAAASPAEYYTFVEGPEGVADLRVRWDAGVRAVVCGDRRLDLDRSGEGVACRVPVEADDPDGCRSTLNVYSHVGDDSLPVRVEHNDPDRRAGHYADHPWSAAKAAAALNFVFGAREALRDWGLPERVREAGTGTVRLMGFESNDPPHGDFPAHWHLNLGHPEAWDGSHIPHLYLDTEGRVGRNVMVVLGYPERSQTYGVGDLVTYRDADGTVRLALAIRPDGGVDLGPAPGEWTYALTPGEGGFPASVAVEREGERWRTVAVEDDVTAGRLSVTVTGDGERTETYDYDPLTGRLG
ncbi:MAG: hypothetical protein ABEH77_08015 [Halobacteriaceae archaeon]